MIPGFGSNGSAAMEQRFRELERALVSLQVAEKRVWKDFDFAEKYLRDSDAFPPDTASRWFPPSAIHLEMCITVERYPRVLMQWPREHAKTGTFSFIRPLRMICEDRRTRIVLISKTADAAERFVGAIRHQLEFNEAILRDFGAFKPSRAALSPEEHSRQRAGWTNQAFTVIREAGLREPTVQALGRGGQVVSGRYEYVVLDDVEDFGSTRTAQRRLDTYTWALNDVEPVVVQGGRMLIIQTPQHESDLIGQIRAEHGHAWRYMNVPCEHDEPDPEREGRTKRVALWPAKWPIYYTDCEVKRAEERGASDMTLAQAHMEACPKCPIFDLSLGGTGGVRCLSGKRWEVGEVFYNLQYRCDTTALGGELWRRDWFKFYGRDEITWKNNRWIYRPVELGGQEHELEVYIGVDPAIADEEEQAKNDRSDFAALVLGYAPKLRRRLVLYTYAERIDFPTQNTVLYEMYTAWRPIGMVIEEISYQRALRQQLWRDYGRLPILPRKHQDSDYYRRWSALTPEFRAGNVYIPVPSKDRDGRPLPDAAKFMQQCVNAPRGTKDDLIDAYDLAQEHIGKTRLLQGEAERAKKAAEKPAWTVAETLGYTLR